MPGYTFNVTMTLENAGGKEQVVSIPRGTLIEPESTHMTFQSAVVNKDYLFTLAPGEIRSVLLEVDCWNRQLSPPKGVPGKLTPFKGNIRKTTDIWKTSSSPAPGTVLYSPSQDGHIFSALAATNPDLARDYLLGVADKIDEPEFRERIEATTAVSRAAQPKELREISKSAAIAHAVSAHSIREYLIRQGLNNPAIIDCIIGLATNLHALNGHRLTSRLYEVALELKDLKDDLDTRIGDEEKEEIIKVVRRKSIDLLDGLPLIDKQNSPGSGRAVSAS